MYTVLIVDSDTVYANGLHNTLVQDGNYDVLGVLHEGNPVLDEVDRLRPEIIFLDLLIAGSDGIYLINHIRHRHKKYHPIIYVLSSLTNENLVKAINSLDINFFSVKPLAYPIVLSNLTFLLDNVLRVQLDAPQQEVLPPADNVKLLELKARRLLMQLGAFPQLASTKCVVDVLVYCMQYPQKTKLITKAVYPAIAEKYNTSSASIEKRIRNTIELIQNNNNLLFQSMFYYVGKNRKVTNKEFIYVVTEYMQVNSTPTKNIG